MNHKARSEKIWLMVGFLALVGGIVAGCSSDVPTATRPASGGAGGATGSASGGTGGIVSAAGGAAGTSIAGAGTGGALAGTGGGGTGGSNVFTPYCDGQTKAPLPLTVTDQFVVSGYYEDSSSEVTNPEGMCPARADGAVGTCLTFTWTPITRTWVGVAFQNPANNWSGPGLCIADGALKVTFKARGAAGGEVASFGVVGQDLNVTLTDSWQEYEIAVSGINYNAYNVAGGVNTGFSWTMERQAADMAVKSIYVDDIRWVAVDEPEGAGGAGGQPSSAGAGGA